MRMVLLLHKKLSVYFVNSLSFFFHYHSLCIGNSWCTGEFFLLKANSISHILARTCSSNGTERQGITDNRTII